MSWQPSMITFHPSVDSMGVTQHNNSSSSSGSSTVLLLICSGPVEVDKFVLEVSKLHITFSILKTGACIVLFLRHTNIMLLISFTWAFLFYTDIKVIITESELVLFVSHIQYLIYVWQWLTPTWGFIKFYEQQSYMCSQIHTSILQACTQQK